jgi:hypothetical protein
VAAAAEADAERQVALLAQMLGRRGGRRLFVPIRRSFVQSRGEQTGSGPLATFVSRRRKRALDLYMLIHAVASTDPFDVALRSRAWAAALGMPDTPSSQVFVSNTLSWLEAQQLIHTARDGALRRIYLLDESGDGEPYRHPAATHQPDYFKLPYAYWLEGWHQRLGLAATAVLLIGLSLRHDFMLPLEHGARWYGISSDTLARGLKALRQAELLTMRSVVRASPDSPTGTTELRRYALQGSFAASERRPDVVGP